MQKLVSSYLSHCLLINPKSKLDCQAILPVYKANSISPVFSRIERRSGVNWHEDEVVLNFMLLFCLFVF